MIEDIFNANTAQLSWLREHLDCPESLISDEILQKFLTDSRGSLKVAAWRALRFMYALEFPPPLVAAAWRFRQAPIKG